MGAGQTVTAGSGPTGVQVCAVDAQGNPGAVRENTTLTLSAPSATALLGANAGGPLVAGSTTITLASGQACATIFFTDTTAGPLPLNIAAGGGLTGDTQGQTINPGPISKLAFIAEPPPVEPCIVSDRIALQTRDRFGNRSPVGFDLRIELGTSSRTGFFGANPGDPFDGSLTAVGLSSSASETAFLYKDCTLGSPEITAREVPSLGWDSASQTRTIALKFTVNNQGKLSVTTVSAGNLTVEQGIRSLSDDQVVAVTVPVTTRAINADGSRVEEVTVDRIAAPPPPPQVDKEIIAVALELGPSGATFNPPLLFTVDYGKLNLPANADVSKISFNIWNGTTWQQVEASVDRQAGTVSAFISHFSTYAVIAPTSEPANDWLPYGLGGAGLMLLGSLFALGYMRRWHIAIALPTGTLAAGTTPQPIHLKATDAKHKPFRPGTGVPVRLSTTSPTGRFDVRPDGPFDGSISKTVIPPETGMVTMYFKDLTPGPQTLRARSEFKLGKWIRSRPPAWTKSKVELLPPDSAPKP